MVESLRKRTPRNEQQLGAELMFVGSVFMSRVGEQNQLIMKSCTLKSHQPKDSTAPTEKIETSRVLSLWIGLCSAVFGTRETCIHVGVKVYQKFLKVEKFSERQQYVCVTLLRVVGSSEFPEDVPNLLRVH